MCLFIAHISLNGYGPFFRVRRGFIWEHATCIHFPSVLHHLLRLSWHQFLLLLTLSAFFFLLRLFFPEFDRISTLLVQPDIPVWESLDRDLDRGELFGGALIGWSNGSWITRGGLQAGQSSENLWKVGFGDGLQDEFLSIAVRFKGGYSQAF